VIQTTYEQAVKGLGALAVYFPRADWSEATVKGWAAELVMFESSDLATAIITLARSRIHPPALAEILDACGEAREQRAERERLSRPRLVETKAKVVTGQEGAKRAQDLRKILGDVGKPMPDLNEERSKRITAAKMLDTATEGVESNR
jgi:hypothetical protein